MPFASLTLLTACLERERDTGEPAEQGFVFGQVLGQVVAIDARRVAIRDDKAYVCAGEYGVYVIDVSDPRNPAYVETEYLGGECHDMVNAADRLWLALGSAGLKVADVSPFFIEGEQEFTDEVRQIAVNDQYNWAYLAHWDGAAARITNWEVSDPAFMVQDDSRPAGTSLPRALHEGGGDVFLVGEDGRLRIFGEFLAELAATDATTIGPGSVDIAFEDDFLYVVQGVSGLQAIRVTEPEAPSVQFALTVEDREIHAVHTQPDRLYVAADGALEIFDIADPYAPTKLSDRPTYIASMQRPSAIVVSNGVAYITDPVDNTLTLVWVGEAGD